MITTTDVCWHSVGGLVGDHLLRRPARIAASVYPLMWLSGEVRVNKGSQPDCSSWRTPSTPGSSDRLSNDIRVCRDSSSIRCASSTAITSGWSLASSSIIRTACAPRDGSGAVMTRWHWCLISLKQLSDDAHWLGTLTSEAVATASGANLAIVFVNSCRSAVLPNSRSAANDYELSNPPCAAGVECLG